MIRSYDHLLSYAYHYRDDVIRSETEIAGGVSE